MERETTGKQRRKGNLYLVTDDVAEAQAPNGANVVIRQAKGFFRGNKKLVKAMWKHPWVTVLGLLTGLGCTFVCSYFGYTILAGLGAWGVYQETDV